MTKLIIGFAGFFLLTNSLHAQVTPVLAKEDLELTSFEKELEAPNAAVVLAYHKDLVQLARQSGFVALHVDRHQLIGQMLSEDVQRVLDELSGETSYELLMKGKRMETSSGAQIFTPNGLAFVIGKGGAIVAKVHFKGGALDGRARSARWVENKKLKRYELKARAGMTFRSGRLEQWTKYNTVGEVVRDLRFNSEKRTIFTKFGPGSQEYKLGMGRMTERWLSYGQESQTDVYHRDGHLLSSQIEVHRDIPLQLHLMRFSDLRFQTSRNIGVAANTNAHSPAVR